jgi:hypothetical protein
MELPVTTLKRTLALALLLTACQDGGTPAIDQVMTTSAADGSAANFADRVASVGLAPMAAKSARPAPPPVAEEAAMRREVAQGKQAIAIPLSGMVIRNGSVAILVDSIEPAIERVRAIATRYGGYVGGVGISAGEHQVRSATLELKIPSARFDSAMGGMPALGKVEHSSVSAEDVGEEFVDISARVANAKRLEERLITLLATKTGKLEDVLRVERELARVREEIERHEGRIRYLTTRVAMSTIHANVHEKPPVIAAHPGDNILFKAFVNMWRNFVRFLVAGIELMGLVIPVAVLALGAWWLFRRWRHRRVVVA